MTNEINNILIERFSKDSLVALATVDDEGKPWVRTIDAIFYDGCFYTITFAKSKKMIHINSKPVVAISGEWFSGHAICENLGHIKLTANKSIANRLRTAFASWYDNGHTNEDDINTIILKIKLVDGILFSSGKRFNFNLN